MAVHWLDSYTIKLLHTCIHSFGSQSPSSEESTPIGAFIFTSEVHVMLSSSNWTCSETN